MAKGYNIRAWLGLDTKDYEKGISKAKRQTRQFTKGLKTSVKGAAGAATGHLDRMTGGAISGFQGMFQGVKMASKGMKGFKAAMISSGVGALVVILGSLVAYFSKTNKGQEKMNELMGGLGGVVDLVMTGLTDLGSFLVDMWNNPKKAIDDFWEMLKTNLINRPQGILDFWTNAGSAIISIFEYLAAKVKLSLADVPIIGKAIDKDKVKKDAETAWAGFTEAAEGAARGAVQAVTGMDEGQQKAVVEGATNMGKDFGKAYSDGVKLGADENALKDAQNKALVAQKKLKTEISKLVRKSREEDKYTEQERLAFIEEAKRKNEELYDSKLAMQEEELRLHQEKMAMGPSTQEDLEKEAELEAGIEGTMADKNASQRELINREITLNNLLQKEYEKRQDIYDKVVETANEGTDLDDNFEMAAPLQDLEEELKRLKEAQLTATDTEEYQKIGKEIKEKEAEIRKFKGEVVGAGEDINKSVNSNMESFENLGQTITDTFGIAEHTWGGFALSLMDTLPKLGSQLEQLGAKELLMSKKKIAAKEGEAIASGTASAASAPWFMSIPLIVSTIGTITSIFSSLPKFESGGILGGNSMSGDKLLFRGNSGEMILNHGQQKNLLKMINKGNSGSSNSGGNVQFEIKGDKLVGVLKNHNSRTNSYR